ncbi:winged helix-turn-helix transcriptional regulator [Herbiconiux sp. P17]|uniref:winged helix-turn-helix transcriptional regulator n=1 Tax=Herbiconiux wuyangfengii TaxID=3342794 RepID=UPI0035B755EE
MNLTEIDPDGSRGLEAMVDEPVERRECSIANSLAVLGERWTFLVVREMLYGAHRFEQIAGYTGISRDILAVRLRTLQEHGVIEKRQYSEHPPRFEYHLTESGRELLPVLLSLAKWGSKWANGDSEPRPFMHSCGHRLDIAYSCVQCGEQLHAEDIEPAPQGLDEALL